MPTKRCCCGGPCKEGCCYPYEYLEVPTPGNYAQILVWVIDAPNCPAIDGATGQFSPETTGPHDPLLTCGFCLCYENSAEPEQILGTASFVNGEECSGTPCGMSVCFGLQCTRSASSTGDECCKHFKLVVVFNAATPTGGDPVDTRGQCFEGEELNGNPIFPGCNGGSQNSVDNATQLAPSFCQCEDQEADPPIDFELVFDLSVLGFGCPLGDFEGGPCDGITQCCEPVDCTFAGATMTVTKL
jgi:hypothetical protein